MARYIDAVGNIIDTTGQNQPPTNAALQPAPDPQAGQSSKTVLGVTYITTGGVSTCAVMCSPA